MESVWDVRRTVSDDGRSGMGRMDEAVARAVSIPEPPQLSAGQPDRTVQLAPFEDNENGQPIGPNGNPAMMPPRTPAST